jgi:hypothetical protein
VIKVIQVNFVMMNFGWNFFFGDSEVWILQLLFAEDKGQCHSRDPKNKFQHVIFFL